MRSALNYDHLSAMFNRCRSISPSLTFGDFLRRAGYTSSGEIAALETLRVFDGNLDTIFLPTGLPFRSVIRLPEDLPGSSTAPLRVMDLAISIRVGLLAAAPYTEAGSSPMALLSNAYLARVLQMQLASAASAMMLPPYTGRPSLKDKFDYYIDLASKPLSSSSTMTAPVSAPPEKPKRWRPSWLSRK